MIGASALSELRPRRDSVSADDFQGQSSIQFGIGTATIHIYYIEHENSKVDRLETVFILIQDAHRSSGRTGHLHCDCHSFLLPHQRGKTLHRASGTPLLCRGRRWSTTLCVDGLLCLPKTRKRRLYAPYCWMDRVARSQAIRP